MFPAAALATLACLAASLFAGIPVNVETIHIPMRDGIKLAANLFRLSNAGRLPVILIRTPYNKGHDLSRNQRVFVEAGYAVVVQDVRGRYESDGVFDPLFQEVPDADDTLTWIARQPWSNGKVGMIGGSYLGIVQWKAALTRNPALKAIFPVVSGCDDYLDRFYSPGGAMKLGHRLSWLSANLKAPGYKPPDFAVFTRHLPVQDADRVAVGRSLPLYQQASGHPSYDGFWKSVSTLDKIAAVHIPVFNTGGWYDNYVESDLAAFSALRKLHREIHTLIGPWAHNMSIPFEEINFGPHSSAPILRIQLDWFARLLRGESGKGHFPPLRIFVMGRNEWRDEEEWPLRRAVPTPFYFSSRKGANSLNGDGSLRARPPRGNREDRFTYDPSNAVPTRGGATCCNPKVFAWGPMDQTVVERRKDVLVYTSSSLRKDLEVTGPIKAVLWVSTTARDTDFTAKLVDVFPDGRAFNLTGGILRLRYRAGLWKPIPVEPGNIYAVTVDAGVTSNVFRAGHRIRVEISSSNYPHYDRNLNTGGPNNSETRAIIANQTLHLGQRHPSHILLPVAP
ncbi:MAG: CocE/NonD family hydrolase [Bryobacterales bacterium]|nr:CocE/NonD family hydrolase [Bryobacterales bacterium]